MKTIYLTAALLLAGSAAHAGSSIAFNIKGHNIRVSAPRNCQSLSCLQISGLDLNGLKSGQFGSNGDADAPARLAESTPAPTAPAPSMPVAAMPAPQASAQAQPVVPSPAAPAAVASAAALTEAQAPAAAPPALIAPAPVLAAAAPVPTAAPAPAAPPPPVAQPAAVASTAPAPDPNSPLGLWATEQNKGNVRIEPCGSNLCGYAEKSGEKILISMRPKQNKWVGRIHDPEGGGNYDSTIALKGPNTLRVQGCAFGGLFCGGQTWKRVG
jgi:uncharacterized protein (DUF2147 family)